MYTNIMLKEIFSKNNITVLAPDGLLSVPVYIFSEKSEEGQGGVQKRGFEIGLSEDNARGGVVLGSHHRRSSSFSHSKGESISTRAVLVEERGLSYLRI